jgi:hypothetical protein
MTPGPLLVCSSAQRPRVELELRACGWRLHPAAEDATPPPGGVLVAPADEVLGTMIVSWAMGGGAVVLVADTGPTAARLVDALRHVRPVVDRRSAPSPLDPLPGDAIALLGRLRDGLSVNDAAQATHMSRRTAYRLLEQGRFALRVASNRELVVASDALLPPSATAGDA